MRFSTKILEVTPDTGFGRDAAEREFMKAGGYVSYLLIGTKMLVAQGGAWLGRLFGQDEKFWEVTHRSAEVLLAPAHVGLVLARPAAVSSLHFLKHAIVHIGIWTGILSWAGQLATAAVQTALGTEVRCARYARGATSPSADLPRLTSNQSTYLELE